MLLASGVAGMRSQPPAHGVPQHMPTPPAAPKTPGLSPKAPGSSASAKGGQTERRGVPARVDTDNPDGAQTERRAPAEWTDMEALRRPSAMKKPIRPIDFGTEVRRRELSAYSDSQGHSGRVPHATFAGVEAASECSPRLPSLASSSSHVASSPGDASTLVPLHRRSDAPAASSGTGSGGGGGMAPAEVFVHTSDLRLHVEHMPTFVPERDPRFYEQRIPPPRPEPAAPSVDAAAARRTRAGVPAHEFLGERRKEARPSNRSEAAALISALEEQVRLGCVSCHPELRCLRVVTLVHSCLPLVAVFLFPFPVAVFRLSSRPRRTTFAPS